MKKIIILFVLQSVPLFANSQTSETDPEKLYDLAHMYLTIKEYDLVITSCNELLEYDLTKERTAEVLHYRGVAFMHLKNYDSALTDLDRSIALIDDNPAVYFTRAAINYLLKRWSKVKVDCEKLLKLDPDKTTKKITLVVLGEMYMELGDFKGALIPLQNAINQYPDYGRAYRTIGRAYQALKFYNGAVKNYDEAIRLDYDKPFTYSLRAVCKYNLGDKVNACRDWSISKGLGYHKASLYFDKYCN